MERLRWSLLSMTLGLCRQRHMVAAEIIVVEWRPPKSTERLADLVPKWLLDGNHNQDFDCQPWMMPPVRVIHVSDEDADAATRNFRSAEPDRNRNRIFQWQCKAVGVRRAAGEFVVTTNADTIWSPMMFNFLSATHLLRRDSFYLTHTIDFEGPLKTLHEDGFPFFQLYDDLFSGQRRWYAGAVQKHVDKLGERYPVIRQKASKYICVNSHSVPIDFRKAEFRHFWQVYDHMFGVRLGVSDPISDLGKPACMGRPRNLFDAQPGDFVLAPREAWFKIGGPPMVFQNLYVDYLVVCRFAAHYRQVVLAEPCFMFHQAHANVTQKTEFHKAENELDAKNMWMHCCNPFLPFASETKHNLTDWGFSDLRLPEAVIMYKPHAKAYLGDIVIQHLQ